MNRVSKGLEHTFVEGFSHRRMGVNRRGDILQNRTHLQRQNEFS